MCPFRKRPLCVRVVAFLLTATFSLAGCQGFDQDLPGFSRLELEVAEVLASQDAYSRDAHVAVNPVSGEVFVCWVTALGGASEIVWRHGLPGAFSGPEPVTDVDGRKSWNPSICAGRDGRVHMAWMDQMIDGVQKEIYVKSWVGGKWGEPELLSREDGWTGWDPDIEALPSGAPAVCWFDHRFSVQHEILLRVQRNDGSWSDDIRLTDDRIWQYSPDMAAGTDGALRVCYVSELMTPEGRNREVFCRTWDGSPGPEIRVTDTTEPSLAPRVAVDPSGVAHLVWLDFTQGGYPCLFYGTVNGTTVGPVIRLSDEDKRADLSDIAVLGSRVFVVYVQYSDPAGSAVSDSSVLLREVLGDGRPGPPLTLATEGTNLHPDMAADVPRGLLWTVWMRYLGTDEELMSGPSRLVLAAVRVR